LARRCPRRSRAGPQFLRGDLAVGVSVHEGEAALLSARRQPLLLAQGAVLVGVGLGEQGCAGSGAATKLLTRRKSRRGVLLAAA
jgi:hypothetical protein